MRFLTDRLNLTMLALAGGLVLNVASAGAEESSPVEKGKELAERLCVKCHAVGRDGDSPMAEAPPFRIMAQKWPVDSLAEAFAEGIVVGHPAMPVFTFEPNDIRNLLTYMDSLSP